MEHVLFSNKDEENNIGAIKKKGYIYIASAATHSTVAVVVRFALTLTSVSRNAFAIRGKEDGKCLASLT